MFYSKLMKEIGSIKQDTTIALINMSNIDGPRATYDIGGTTFRRAIVDPAGVVPESIEIIKKLHQIATNPQLLANVFADNIIPAVQQGQKIFVISIAGPIQTEIYGQYVSSPAGRIVEKFTNIFDDRNIHFADMIEIIVKNKTGVDIEIICINDGPAGTFAEMGKGGALINAEEGVAFGIGTGLAGHYAKRVNGILTTTDIIREPGHTQMIFNRGSVNCGCGTTTGCIEPWICGPGSVRTAQYLADTIQEFETDSLGNYGVIIGSLTPEIISDAVNRNIPSAKVILKEMTWPMAALLRTLWVNHSEMRVVFNGGFALSLGDNYLQAVIQHLQGMGNAPFATGNGADYLAMSTLNPNDINLLGSREYLRQVEISRLP
ncbi:MAG: hypothetical protein ABIH39_04125 [Candidatus Margulisiibacteriota bacterium]